MRPIRPAVTQITKLTWLRLYPSAEGGSADCLKWAVKATGGRYIADVLDVPDPEEYICLIVASDKLPVSADEMFGILECIGVMDNDMCDEDAYEIEADTLSEQYDLSDNLNYLQLEEVVRDGRRGTPIKFWLGAYPWIDFIFYTEDVEI